MTWTTALLAEIKNDLDLAVDISNLFLEELNAVVPPGVVVPAKSNVLLLFERRPTTKEDGFTVFVAQQSEKPPLQRLRLEIVSDERPPV